MSILLLGAWICTLYGCCNELSNRCKHVLICMSPDSLTPSDPSLSKDTPSMVSPCEQPGDPSPNKQQASKQEQALHGSRPSHGPSRKWAAFKPFRWGDGCSAPVPWPPYPPLTRYMTPCTVGIVRSYPVIIYLFFSPPGEGHLSVVIFFTPGRRWVEKPLPHSFEPRFESRRPDAAKRRLALGVGTRSRQDPTESRAADQG